MGRTAKRRTPPPTKAKSRHDLEQELANARTEIEELEKDKEELEDKVDRAESAAERAQERLLEEKQAHRKTRQTLSDNWDMLRHYKSVLVDHIKGTDPEADVPSNAHGSDGDDS